MQHHQFLLAFGAWWALILDPACRPQVTLVTVVWMYASPSRTAFWVNVYIRSCSAHLPVRNPVDCPVKHIVQWNDGTLCSIIYISCVFVFLLVRATHAVVLAHGDVGFVYRLKEGLCAVGHTTTPRISDTHSPPETHTQILLIFTLPLKKFGVSKFMFIRAAFIWSKQSKNRNIFIIITI